MKLKYYGHACFCVEVNGIKLLFDPFITGNEFANAIKLDEVEVDYILITHGHQDHIMDCEALAIRTGAKVICNWEIHEWLNAKGVLNTHPMNMGGKWTFDDFTVKCVVAQHSSMLPDGSYGGNPMGFIVYSNNESFYYSGDTALTLDMQLIPLWANLKFAILPIGDNFTMGIEDAIRASEFVKATKVVGVHYDTFGYIKVDKANAINEFKNSGIELLLPNIGETIDL